MICDCSNEGPEGRVMEIDNLTDELNLQEGKIHPDPKKSKSPESGAWSLENEIHIDRPSLEEGKMKSELRTNKSES
jgi:hypothetical protein